MPFLDAVSLNVQQKELGAFIALGLSERMD